jgi:putative addiction module killer protein
VTVRVEEYLRTDGSCPYRRWADGLLPEAAAKVAMAVFRISRGHRSRLKWFDGLGEYRIDWGPGYRIYLLQDGPDLILLLGGGTKHRQQADIERAQLLRTEYLDRKRTR